MQNSRRDRAGQISTWVLAAACFGAGGAMLGLAGCEKMESASRQGDRSVDKSLAESEVARDKGGDKSTAEVMKNLQAAAGVTDASTAGKARAKSELAREEFDLAEGDVPEITRRSLQIEQALWEMREAGAEVRATQRSNADAAQLEPKPGLAKLEENRATIKQNLDKAKAAGDAAQAELDKRQKEIDGLKAERAAAEAEADDLAEKSSAAKGAESVALFTKSTEARGKAGTLAAQIDVKTATLLRYQRSVAIAKQQQQVWDNANRTNPGAMQDLDATKAQLDAGWQGKQSQIKMGNDLAKKVVDTVVTPKSDAKQSNAGARYIALVKENDAQRKGVIDRLSASIKHYGEAAAAAKSLHTELTARVNEAITKNPSAPPATATPEVPVWKSLMSLYDENALKLQQANAQTALGEVYAAQALELAHRKSILEQLSQALQGSGLQLPAELAIVDPAPVLKEADAAYLAAETSLLAIQSGLGNAENAKAMRDAVTISLLLTRYGHFQATLNDKEKKELADELKGARDSNLELPPSLRKLQL